MTHEAEETKLEMQKINSVVNFYARRGFATRMRAAILKDLQRGFVGDYETLIRNYRDAHGDWFAEGK